MSVRLLNIMVGPIADQRTPGAYINSGDYHLLGELMIQPERTRRFRQMHHRSAGMLVLPNAWDVISARIIEAAGAAAIGTTSAGVSWSLGRPDGHGAKRSEMIEAVARIAAAVRIPTTADIESGYGAGRVEDVIDTVRAVAACGVSGVNIEDGADSGVVAAEDHAERIRGARSAAREENTDLVINARVDMYLYQVGKPEERFAETVRRARLYAAAGADCIFVPGVVDRDVIHELARSIGIPLNIMAGPGAPSIGELRELGVARVSLGPAITQTVMAYIQDATNEVLNEGTYQVLTHRLEFSAADRLFSGSI